MASDCDESWYYITHEDECKGRTREDRDREREEEEEEYERGLSETERIMLGINTKRIDPITAVTQNKMFPFIALGALGVAAYLLFFNKGKNKLI